jgi:WD40 repeat protein
VSLAFSPDSKLIVSGHNDNTVSVSHWNTDDLISEVCNLLPRNFTHNEWKQNFGEEPYRPTCPNLPIPSN